MAEHRLTKKQAIQELSTLINTADGAKQRAVLMGPASFVEWRRNAEVAIAYVFGEESRHVQEFRAIAYAGRLALGSPGSDMLAVGSSILAKGALMEGIDKASALIRSMVKEVQDYWQERDESDEQERVDVEVRGKGVSVASLHRALDQYERQHPEVSKRRLQIIRHAYTPELIANADAIFKAAGLIVSVQTMLGAQPDFSLLVPKPEIIECALHAIQALRQVGGIDAVRKRLAEITLLSQEMLSSIDMEAIRRSLKASEPARKTFEASFSRFSHTYTRFYAALEESQLDLKPFGDQFAELPAEGFFCATDAVRTLVTPYSEDTGDARLRQARDRIRSEGGEVLQAELILVDPQLLPTWKGLQDIISSNNPEKGRYVCSSLREILTRTLHSIAPDEKIRAWSSESKHYDEKKRPTRRARLEYLCRETQAGPLRAVVEKEVKFALDLIAEVNRVAHALPSDNDERLLGTLVTNTETAVRIMLTVSAVRG